jgi:hypothetical protein
MSGISWWEPERALTVQVPSGCCLRRRALEVQLRFKPRAALQVGGSQPGQRLEGCGVSVNNSRGRKTKLVHDLNTLAPRVG